MGRPSRKYDAAALRAGQDFIKGAAFADDQVGFGTGSDDTGLGLKTP